MTERINNAADSRAFGAGALPMSVVDSASPESKTLEFKHDLSLPKPLLKTLVAFANTVGGHLGIKGARLGRG